MTPFIPTPPARPRERRLLDNDLPGMPTPGDMVHTPSGPGVTVGRVIKRHETKRIVVELADKSLVHVAPKEAEVIE